jgi:lipid-binding SYLF domain-containing protein
MECPGLIEISEENYLKLCPKKAAITTLLLLFAITPAFALSRRDAGKIHSRVHTALASFESHSHGAAALVHKARGVLIFPGLVKAGFIFGGEHGLGELRVNGKTVGYYSLTGGSWGAQIGAESRDLIIAFMTDGALQQFRKTDGFKIGVDASVSVIKVGAGADIDTNTITAPIVAVVRNQKGLMLDLSLNGSQIGHLKVDH